MRGVAAAWDIAPVLAVAGADVAWCERAGQVLDASTLEPGMEWVASALSAAVLLPEVKEATERVSGLVTAMKSYTQLDRASLQFIDVTEGIDSTLVVLGEKLGDGVTVIRDYGPACLGSRRTRPTSTKCGRTSSTTPSTPWAPWNAPHLDTGRTPSTSSSRSPTPDPGMPAEVLARAFEPFYTTKDVGKGPGLGLDIARRIIVERHHGQITIDSRPGETIFRVQLPYRRNTHQ